jgi:gliding motility-associated-like protein
VSIKFYLTITFITCFFTAHTQLPVLHWAKAFTAKNVWTNPQDNSNGRSVAVDLQGNVYSAGFFSNTVDFDPGPGVFTLSAGGTGQNGIYITKLSPNGDLIWAKQIPELVEFGDIEIEVDKNGNVFLASDLRQPADMDPGPAVHILTPIGAMDAFVVKWDTDGNFIWAKQFGGPGDTVPHSNDLEIDQDGNIIVCGAFNNTVDFDPGPNTFNLTSTAHMQSYIAKLTNDGNFIWAKQFGNSPVVYCGSQITEVRCDLLGNIYTVGGFAGNCDFDPGPATFNMQSTGLRDGFIAKLDANGNFVWAKQTKNTTGDYYDYVWSRGIEIDNQQNVYTTGYFVGDHDFDPGPNVHQVSSNNGTLDFYVLKLDNAGNFIWADVIGSTDSDNGNDISVDNLGNVYVIGEFGKTVDFDPGPGQVIINNPYYGASALVKLNSNGGFIYAHPFQGATATSTFRRMKVDAAQNIYIAGSLSGTMDFDYGPNVYSVTATTNSSPFVAKLGKCLNVTTRNLQVTACKNYSLNNITYDSTGTYTQVIPNSFACDSIITLNLTINKKRTTQTKAICEGESYFVAGANQQAQGIYYDTLSTALGCDSIVATTLVINPRPAPNLGLDRGLCNNTTLTITPGTFSAYEWQDMSTANSFTVSTPGWYWVTVKNQYNCFRKDSVYITALAAPANFLAQTDSVCASANIKITPTAVFASYLWSTGDTTSQLVINTPGTYWLKTSNTNGCYGTDTILVVPKTCFDDITIPNVFSPNGDGINDTWIIKGLEKYTKSRIAIYSRYGQMMYSGIGYKIPWDGKHNGKELPVGTYYFVIDPVNGNKPRVGYVTILK